MARRAKNVMVVADLHCGHIAGLVPPSHHKRAGAHAGECMRELLDTQRRLWDVFAKAVQSFPVPDLLIVNGDVIDGRGERSGGVELTTTDTDEQAAMGAECIKFIRSPKVLITAGTAYHSGRVEDKERLVAKLVSESKHTKMCEFHSSLEVEVNGFMFDAKHHIGGGQSSITGDVALRHEDRHNQDWAELGIQSRADIFLRSHQHAFRGGWLPGTQRMAFITPALQALGGRFGARRCGRVVNWGFMWFEVREDNVLPTPVLPKEITKCQKRASLSL